MIFFTLASTRELLQLLRVAVVRKIFPGALCGGVEHSVGALHHVESSSVGMLYPVYDILYANGEEKYTAFLHERLQ
jgi:hypothetical protein